LSDIAPLLADVATVDLQGTVRLDLELGGRVTSPVVAGRLAAAQVTAQLANLKIDDLGAELEIDGGAISVVDLHADVAGGRISASGQLPILEQATPVELSFDVAGVDLGALWPPEAEGPERHASIDVSGRVRASRLALDALQAEVRLSRLPVTIGDARLDLEAPVDLTLAGGRFSHSPWRLVGPSDRIDVTATGTIDEDGVLGSASVDGDLNLALLNAFLGGEAFLEGRLALRGSVERTLDGWRIAGEANASGAQARLPEANLSLRDVSGRLLADGETIQLSGWTGRIGDGDFTAEGDVVLAETGPVVDLRLSATQVPLSYPEGLRTRSTATLALTGDGGRLRLAGNIDVHRAVYERTGSAVHLTLERAGVNLAALRGEVTGLGATDLDLQLRLENGLEISTGEADLRVEGAVHVAGNLNEPEVEGSLTVQEGGTVRLSRAQIRIESGRVELAGFPTRPPEVDVRGITQVTGIRIIVGISGPLDNVSLDLTAPDRSNLSSGDLASLILTGRTASEAASDSGAILAEEIAASLGEAIGRSLGGAVMVDVSRDESLIVEDANPTQRLNIGIPLTSRLYVIYSDALDRQARRLILEFRPDDRFRLRVIGNDDGSEAVEVAHRFGLYAWSRPDRLASPSAPVRRLRDLSIAGVPDDEIDEARERLDLRSGRPFDYFVSEEARERLETWYSERGFPAATVSIGEVPVGPDRIDAAVAVDRGPRLEFEWQGDDVDRGSRRQAESGWTSYIPLEETAEQHAGRLRAGLQAERYFQAVVTTDVVERADGALIVFDVQRGPRGQDVDVRFAGNSGVNSSILREALPAPTSPEFFTLLEPAGARSLDAFVRFAYAREGFLDAHAGLPDATVDASQRFVVTIPIDEGQRARIADLELPEEVRQAGQRPEFELRRGEPFDVEAYVRDRSRLADWYRAQGYVEARIVGLLEPAPEGLVVRFRAAPGPRPVIDDIRLARDIRTRTRVVEDAVTMKSGDFFTPEAARESRDRLSESRVFRSIGLRLDPESPDRQARDLVVDLAERNDLDVEYSLRYATESNSEPGSAPAESDAGFQVGAAVEAVNPFGWGHRYRAYGLLGDERQLLGARFESATFFGIRWGTQVSVFQDLDRPFQVEALREDVVGATFEQTARWRSGVDGLRFHDRLRVQWGYMAKRITYRERESGVELVGFRAGPIQTVVGDQRDSVTDPHRGIFWSLGSELALRGLGSDVNYVKLYGQLFGFVPLGSRVVWAQGLRLGVAPGNDPLLLLENRFQAGGATSVRGFPENSLGPETAAGLNLGGQSVAIFNQELRFPLFGRLHAGVFYDAGNVFALASDLDFSNLRQNAGAGLRLMFPFGPVRFDWAWVLDPQAGEDRDRWTFSIGHAF
jgi:outer membrane protein assembly factor BamA